MQTRSTALMSAEEEITTDFKADILRNRYRNELQDASLLSFSIAPMDGLYLQLL